MIVAIGHKKRRGKDTAADALVRELGFARVGFADALKAFAVQANPIVLTEPGYVNVQLGHNRLANLVERYGWEYVKDHYPHARDFLQDVGEGARQVFGADFWVNVWTGTLPAGRDIVVPDLRRRNEAELLHASGALLVRIDRKVGTSDSDISEVDLDDFDGWDHVIVNEGGVHDLQMAIVTWVKERQHAPAAVQ